MWIFVRFKIAVNDFLPFEIIFLKLKQYLCILALDHHNTHHILYYIVFLRPNKVIDLSFR